MQSVFFSKLLNGSPGLELCEDEHDSVYSFIMTQSAVIQI